MKQIENDVEVLKQIKYRYLIIGLFFVVCVVVVSERLSPNNILTDIAGIVGLYLYPLFLIIYMCRKNNFVFWQRIKPVKFQPVRELTLPLIMATSFNLGLFFY